MRRTRSWARHGAFSALLLTALGACGDGGGYADLLPDGGGAGGDAPSEVDETAALFDPDRILDVAIEIDVAEWDALRAESRSHIGLLAGDACLDEPFSKPFFKHPGAITVDGIRRAPVAIRKKGFLGSLSATKPSLKIFLDAYIPGLELHGTDELVLNNSIQDPSYVRQCLAYDVFRRAGVPAPRCNFARVSVNGEDLGLYVHVEHVGKAMLRATYGEDDGTLYEGTLSDFRDGWEGTFEKETHEDEPTMPGIQPLADALLVDDADLLARLAPLVDTREFSAFWATEVMLAHWDGYAGNTNNYYLYVARDGRMHFLPWGTDQTMQGRQRRDFPSVMAQGALTRRLYELPETRAYYFARLRGVLETAWREDRMIADIERMHALIARVADPDGSLDLAGKIELVKTFVRDRQGGIEEELAEGPPTFTNPLRAPICFDTIGTVSGTFTTTWGTIGAPDAMAAGDGALDATIRGTAKTFTQIGSTAGFTPDTDSKRAQIAVVADDGTNDLTVLVLDVATPRVVPGLTTVIDWVSAQGVLYSVNKRSGEWTSIGWVGDGSIMFGAASGDPGAPITGTFSAELIEIPD